MKTFPGTELLLYLKGYQAINQQSSLMIVVCFSSDFLILAILKAYRDVWEHLCLNPRLLRGAIRWEDIGLAMKKKTSGGGGGRNNVCSVNRHSNKGCLIHLQRLVISSQRVPVFLLFFGSTKFSTEFSGRCCLLSCIYRHPTSVLCIFNIHILGNMLKNEC